MSKTIEQAADDAVKEVQRAQAQWGTDFDDKNTLNDWTTYANIYLGRAASMGAPGFEVVRNLRKAAGLVLSALTRAENGKLAPRHYEGDSPPESLPDIDENKV